MCIRDRYKSLYRVLGAIAGSQGRIGADQDLLATLVSRHVCNSYGSQVIGQMIAPLVEAAIEQEGYTRIANSASPILISLKGASAAGKSSLRPMVKQIMREQGIDPDSYACLLYTSDAADERSSVDLGGRRIIKKKKTLEYRVTWYHT